MKHDRVRLSGAETKFESFSAFIAHISLTQEDADSGMFVLDMKDISEQALEQFSMFRNEFYEVNLFHGIREFEFTIDGSTYRPDGKPYICFVAPNQLQSYRVLGGDEEAKGFMIYISKEVFRSMYQQHKDVLFFKREYASYYELSESAYEELDAWVQLMKKELNSSSLLPGDPVSRHLLAIFFAKAKQLVSEEKNALHDRPQEILDSFLELIDQAERPQSVAHYASRLALTPKQLNGVTKRLLGKTAQQTVKENTVERAKALLLQSSASVAEVSYQLGFEETSNFSRLFKSVAEQSPKAFRQLHGLN